MRLLTHNQIVCIRKGCDNAFPLQLVFQQVEQEDSVPDVNMVLHMISRIDYPVLLSAARALELEGYPDELPQHLDAETHRELLENLHTLMFDIHVKAGQLVCPVCAHAYEIQAGIPNLRIDESDL